MQKKSDIESDVELKSNTDIKWNINKTTEDKAGVIRLCNPDLLGHRGG